MWSRHETRVTLARSVRCGHVQFDFWLSRCVGGGLANSECSRTRDGCDGRGSAASRLRGVARRFNIPPSHTLHYLSFLCAPWCAARCCIHKVRGVHVVKGGIRATTIRAEGHACAPLNAFPDHQYHRAVHFKKKPEWTLIGCCRLMRALPGLHQCLSSHRIACLRRESHAGLLLVANETNQALARRSDGRQIEWTRVASNSQHPAMRIHRRITTTRYTSRVSSKPAPQTSGLCTTQLTAEERRKAHMAMCRRRHSVRSWRIGIHRKARHAPRLRWTRWPVSLAQVHLLPKRP